MITGRSDFIFSEFENLQGDFLSSLWPFLSAPEPMYPIPPTRIHPQLLGRGEMSLAILDLPCQHNQS